jgi:mRNA interferase MazF
MQPGEYWVASIPFTSGGGAKKRPVLLLWLDGNDVVVAAVTSAGPRSATDVVLAEWKASGLRVASTVRLSRLDCLEQSLLIAPIGKVSANDADEIKKVWQQKVGPRF